MCRVLLLIIPCAVLGLRTSCRPNARLSEEEAAYWLAVDNMIAFLY